MGSTGKSELKARAECPICGGEVTRTELDGTPRAGDAYPFCSERCRLVDLSRWLDESYRIPDKLNES
jgi:endogenous inhibitor of DNA gyrase (YacG/DUF329 family)